MRSAEIDRASLRVGASTAIGLRSPSTSAPSKARRWVRTQLGDTHDDIDIVVTELVGNAIKHGDAGMVALSLERLNDAVIVVVTNPARPDTPDISLPDGAPDPSALGGRGLAIARALSLDLTVVQLNGSIEVTAHIECTSAEQPLVHFS